MNVHIGKEIEKKFQESGLKITVFAERINTGERNVYSLFKRKDISAEMLAMISDVLSFNFFKLYEDQLPKPQSAEEGLAEYHTAKNAISISINLKISNENIDVIPEFLKEIRVAALRYGARLV